MYKYWYVSFVVPIQLKFQDPSKKMKRCLKTVFFIGILIVLSSEIIGSLAYVMTDLKFTKNCFLAQVRIPRAIIITKMELICVQLLMCFFFLDAARRIYFELKSNSWALNLKSMLIHIFSFFVYVIAGIVDIVILAKIHENYDKYVIFSDDPPDFSDWTGEQF